MIDNFACESSNGNSGQCKCSKPYAWDGKGCNDCDASLKYEKNSKGTCGKIWIYIFLISNLTKSQRKIREI